MEEENLKPGQLRIDWFYIQSKAIIKPKQIKPTYEDFFPTFEKPYEVPASSACLIEEPIRKKSRFSQEAKFLLEEAYENCHYIVGEAKSDLAERTGLTKVQISNWFASKRSASKAKTSNDE